MKPTVRPSRPGAACWDQAYAESMLSSVARVGESHASWFLSTHSPITCTSSEGELSERDIFERLYDSAGQEYLVVVKGGPGAGKSQLINWLKLRFDETMASGRRPAHRLATLRTVMIKRRSGSLKDALQQLVDQLPGYEHYLADVSAAISELNSEQANRKLCFALAAALHAARQNAPRDLRALSELFNDVGAIEHMARPGGVVSDCIARLTTGSEAVEHGTLPEFTAREFEVPRMKRTAVSAELLDLLEDDSAFREQAAQEANKHLRAAIADLTGLRGQTLYEVFRSIRKDLRRANECLAFFVEDVSTLSVLDQELVNAVQPQNDGQLCEMLSVLGMTIPAYEKLPDNLQQRIDLALEIKGERTGHSALSDPTYVDQFTARYLNALRAGEDQLKKVVEGRQHHGDVSDIACEGCELQEACFATFGAASLGHARIGLFPFSPGAASRLLKGLSVKNPTPRDLLQKIVDPLLRAAHREFKSEGSTVGLDVIPRTPADAAAKKAVLLGGWNNQQQDRLSYFLWYWTGAETLEQGAGHLKPMLDWLGLPAFSRAVKVEAQPDPAVRATPPINAATPPLPGYQDAIRRLDVWFQQKGKLEKDKEYRDYLVDVVKRSIQTESYRSPSADQRSRTKNVNASNIEIEDMKAHPVAGSAAKFKFARSEDTYELLKVLCDYNYKGKSWHFEGAETQRRIYAKWLRRNETRIVAAYALDRVDPSEALKLAARFLILAYRFCERKELPTDTSSAVQLLTSFKPSAPESLSTIGKRIAGDAAVRVETIRKLLLDGLNVPQGTGGLNFIDPTLIIQTIADDPRPMGLPALDDEWESGHFFALWSLCNKSAWRNLEPYLDEEIEAMNAHLASTRDALAAWGIHGESLQDDLREFLESARDVAKALESTNQSTGEPDLHRRILGLTPAEVNRQINSVIEVEALLSSGDRAAVLTCDVGRFIKQVESIDAVHALMKKCAENLARNSGTVLTEAELDLERSRAKQSLDQLVTIAVV